MKKNIHSILFRPVVGAELWAPRIIGVRGAALLVNGMNVYKVRVVHF